MSKFQNSTKFYSMILDGISEAIVVVSDDGMISFVNRAALKMFGYQEKELLARKIEVLLPADLRIQHQQHRGKYMIAPLSRPMGSDLDLHGLRKDGSRFPVEVGLDCVDIRDETLVIAIITEITHRKNLEGKLIESEERWEFALEGSAQGVWDWNVETGEVFLSGQWKALLGFAENEMENSLAEWEARVHPDDLESSLEEIKRHLDGDTPVYVHEHRLLCKDGSYMWIFARGKVMSRTPEGRPLRMVGTNTDITDRKRAEEVLRNLAMKDALTGLYNRRAFAEKLNYEQERFLRTGRPFSLILCDIDNFKNVNDTYGHDCGDMVLKKIAKLMQGSMRKHDCVGRWGGEEFIMLLPETGLDGGRLLAEKVRELIAEEKFSHGKKPLNVTMSFGVAEHGEKIELSELTATADKRLYIAKEHGRNRVVDMDGD